MKDRISDWLACGVVALAVGIQIHTTLPIGALGVRISMADMFLPFVILAAFWAGFRFAWPTGGIAWLLVLLALATLWIFVSIGHGRIELGYWHSWAVINRGFGWVLLMAYFAAGWIVGHLVPDALSLRLVKAYLVFFWFGCLASGLIMISLLSGWFGLTAINEPDASPLQQTFGLITGKSRFQGFVINPNAFGFLAALAIALHIPVAKRQRLFEKNIHAIGLGISFFGLFWSFSRGAWLGSAASILFLLLWRQLDYWLTVRALALAVLLSAALWFSSPIFLVNIDAPDLLETAVAGSPGSIDHRRQIIERALELWAEAPWFGIGVGVFLDRQALMSHESLSSIHSSYLWLLVETGAIGLMLFAVAFFVAIVALLRSSEKTPDPFFVGAAAMLVASAAIAIAMDVLSQRPIWLFLGVALGLAAKRKQRERVLAN